MDYEEEQASELDTLESIYCDDIEVINANYPRKLKIKLRAAEEDPGLLCSLEVTHTRTYPDEPPDIQVEDSENLEDSDKEQLRQHLIELAKENLGMVMVFTLAAAGQEWLETKSDQIKKDMEEGALKKKLADEEAERKRFEGTRVSVETFLAWKNNFELETGIASRREKEYKENRKLTGKELFLRDTTLNESDLKFLDDGDAVKVDESLFQDLEDLDITDEEDDDYVLGESEDDN